MKNNIDEIEEQNSENKIINEVIEEKEIPKKGMSKGEKLFWVVIVFFTIVYVVISMIASNNLKDLITENTKPSVLEKYVTKYLPDDTIKNNISKGESIINKKLNEDMDDINSQIDKEVDELFVSIEKNVDTYLDFHYSVYGEYSELLSLAANDLTKDIQNKLFGAEFNQVFEDKINKINLSYKKKIEDHIQLINDIGIEGVDKDLNNASLEYMINDIENFRNVILGKSLLAVTTATGSKVALAISARIAAKSITKATTKAALKTAGKISTSGTAAAAGLGCGPFFWVCSPVAATAAWFATDAVVASADEMLNRDDFKNEIMSSLNESKNEIKNNLKKSIEDEFKLISEKVKETIKNTPVIKKERIRVGDKVDVLFNTPQEAINSIKEGK